MEKMKGFRKNPIDPIFDDLKLHIVERFFKFHESNPKIFDLYKRFALELKQSGRVRYSSMMILQRIRWHVEVETNDTEFKVNNNHAPCYARLLMLYDSHYRKVFKRRARLPGDWGY